MLVAPLNWGLGHATRCIPIIKALSTANFEPIIASDGDALRLLKEEFPQNKFIELPSYNIKYSRSGWGFRLKLLLNTPKILYAIKTERRIIAKLVAEGSIAGIISDNRYGVINSAVPSVFITHQLNVLSGVTTWLSSRIQQWYIQKFDQCWVPDFRGEFSLAGRLSHLRNSKLPLKYIGGLSRFKFQTTDKKYDLLILLSGPEPQRSVFEKKIIEELKNYQGKVALVRGKFTETNSIKIPKNVKVYNYQLSSGLQNIILESSCVLARSGYSTIMDLSALGKKAFFVPTPGQYEQEYLASELEKRNIAPFSTQEKFSIKMLDTLKNYKGFIPEDSKINELLFGLFQCK